MPKKEAKIAKLSILDRMVNFPGWLMVYILAGAPALFINAPRSVWLPYLIPAVLVAILLGIINSVIISRAQRFSAVTIIMPGQSAFPKRYYWLFYVISCFFGFITLVATMIATNEVLVPRLLHANHGGPVFWMSYMAIPLCVLALIPVGLFVQSIVRLVLYGLGSKKYRSFLQRRLAFGPGVGTGYCMDLKSPSVDLLQIVGSIVTLLVVWGIASVAVTSAGVYVYPDKVVKASFGHVVTIPASKITKVDVYVTDHCEGGGSTPGSVDCKTYKFPYYSAPCGQFNGCSMYVDGHIRFYGAGHVIGVDSHNSMFDLYGGTTRQFYAAVRAQHVPVSLQPLSDLEKKPLQENPDTMSQVHNVNLETHLSGFYGLQSDQDLLKLPAY